MKPAICELFDLTGKVALVTGGAGWLGMVLAEILAQAGAIVALMDNNTAALERTVQRFDESDLKALGIAGDVMQDEPLRLGIDKVARDCGRLDILVNCAYAGPHPSWNRPTSMITIRVCTTVRRLTASLPAMPPSICARRAPDPSSISAACTGWSPAIRKSMKG